MWYWQTKDCILLALMYEECWIFFSVGRHFSLLQLVCGQLTSTISYDSETRAGFWADHIFHLVRQCGISWVWGN